MAFGYVVLAFEYEPPCFGRWPEAGGRVGWPVSGSDGYPVLPLAPGRFRLPYGAAPGPFARDAPREAGPDPLDGPGAPGALREEPGLDLLADEAQAVADVGAQGRPVVAVVEIVVAAVRARAGEGDANEGGVELLADAAFGLGVEGLDPERPGRVPFFHAPTSRIAIGDRRDGIPVAVEPGGREAGFRVRAGRTSRARRVLERSAVSSLGASRMTVRSLSPEARKASNPELAPFRMRNPKFRVRSRWARARAKEVEPRS